MFWAWECYQIVSQIGVSNSKYNRSSCFVQVYFLRNGMVLKKFKFCKIAQYFKSHYGPDRKQERNGVDLSKMTVTDEIKNEFAGIFLDHQKWIMDWENFLRKWWLFMFTFENYKMGGVGFRSPPPEISINWHKKIMRNSSIILCVV